MADLRWIALGVVGALGAGCSVTDSEGIETSSLWPRYLVAHDGDTVVVQAMLRVGGPAGTMVDLTDGDYFEVNGTRMTEWVEEVTDYHWSRAVVPATADDTYEIVFVRTGEAVATPVVVPAEPVITGTEPASVVGTLDPLTVLWDASDPGDGVEVRVEGDCVLGIIDSDLPDSGSHTTQALQDGGGAPADCEIKARVIRTLTRLIDPAFEGGWSEAYRADEMTISYDSIGGQ